MMSDHLRERNCNLMMSKALEDRAIGEVSDDEMIEKHRTKAQGHAEAEDSWIRAMSEEIRSSIMVVLVNMRSRSTYHQIFTTNPIIPGKINYSIDPTQFPDFTSSLPPLTIAGIPDLPTPPTGEQHEKEIFQGTEVVMESNDDVLEEAEDSGPILELLPFWPCSSPGCGAMFHKPTDLADHLSIHDDSTLGVFKCPRCVNWYRREKDVITHAKTHNLKKAIRCPARHNNGTVCGNLFANATQVRNHVKTFKRHFELRPIRFACPRCDRTFGVKFNLARHIQQHEQGRVPCYQGFGKTFAAHHIMIEHAQNQH
ncbi:uncharacterized protein L199_006693 [Kwoniella botswanensis]|uniref:uncharacterized protein n=1 Tax=Kwoniella botswanensis TaxID=1268659 RepID=UPI00315DA73F